MGSMAELEREGVMAKTEEPISKLLKEV